MPSVVYQAHTVSAKSIEHAGICSNTQPSAHQPLTNGVIYGRPFNTGYSNWCRHVKPLLCHRCITAGQHSAVLVSDPRTSRSCHQQRIVGAFAAVAEVLFACMSKQSVSCLDLHMLYPGGPRKLATCNVFCPARVLNPNMQHVAQ